MKVYRLIVKEEAKEEVSEAYYRYESKLGGLGEQMLDALDECFFTISHRPTLFAKKHKDMRQATIKKFPYVVIYEIEKNDIVIYAIFHTSRDPEIWKNR
jgi:hypothetical protein